MSPSGKKTLDRVLSRSGWGSRTQARLAIAAGRVRVNGRTVRDPDLWIDLGRDRIDCDGAPLLAQPKQVWMLHKPVGYVTTADDELGRPTVYALLPPATTWLAPVGRLDQDTSGLLLFTNDSDLAHAITAPASKLPKTYEVRCKGHVAEAALHELATGIQLDDGITRPADVVRLDGDDRSTLLRLTITEGRNRQVRRMIAAVGSRVLSLHRTRIGPLPLQDLASGAHRRLTAAETLTLRRAVTTQPDGRPRRTNPDRAR